MKIILFSLPGAGRLVIKKLVKQGTPPTCVVPPASNNPARDEMIDIAHQYDIPVIRFDHSPAEEKFIALITKLKPDLILVTTFPYLIPESVYSVAKIASINAHSSLLPEYRGVNPFYHVIANGEAETGVTLHLLDKQFDTGDILSQAKLPISSRETTGTLQNKLMILIALEVATMVNTINKQGLPKLKKQSNHNIKNKAPRLELPLKDINWNHSAIQIDRNVRAANPYYPILSLLLGVKVRILSGKPINTSSSNNNTSGYIISIDEKGMLVSTGGGDYLVTSVSYGAEWTGDPLGLIELGFISIGDTFS